MFHFLPDSLNVTWPVHIVWRRTALLIVCVYDRCITTQVFKFFASIKIPLYFKYFVLFRSLDVAIVLFNDLPIASVELKQRKGHRIFSKNLYLRRSKTRIPDIFTVIPLIVFSIR